MFSLFPHKGDIVFQEQEIVFSPLLNVDVFAQFFPFILSPLILCFSCPLLDLKSHFSFVFIRYLEERERLQDFLAFFLEFL